MDKTTFRKFKNCIINLNDGNSIPAIGFGTFQIKTENEISTTLSCALETGYKHIDSAQIYRNEKLIGDFIKNNKIKRDEIFITSKISTKNMNYWKAKNSIDESLKNFSLDYIDLMLIHWPEAETLEDRLGVWKALEEAVESKKVRSIGVSNFLPLHLKSIMENKNTKLKPAVNQIEIHPLFIDWETINFCRNNNIILQAYCPVARMHEKLIRNDTLMNLALKYNKSIPQILIRWSLQNDFCVLIKSANQERIKENFDIDDFDIEENDIKLISSLNCDFKVSWDPRRLDKF